MLLAHKLICVLALVVIGLLLSAIKPHDYLTWLLEVTPVLIAIPLLIWTYKPFPLTGLLYSLIFIHALVLILGGHYTYANVPVGFWAQELFDFERNHYDRFGHFMQGFMPAILAREILLRKNVVKPGKWLFLIVFSICLAFSAFYELLEWWAALIYGADATNFLGTQGDEWDTQADMFMAAVGAISALLLLRKVHDRQLKNL
jgi:putative membrane protein